MKFRISVKKENEEELRNFLAEHGIEVAESGEYVLTENIPPSKRIHVKKVKSGDRVILSADEIVYLESYNHNIYIHGDRGEYISGEPLGTFESILDSERFVRVSVSVIVSISHITEIRPSIARKYILCLSNGAVVDVTRSYYVSFKKRFDL